ncbi:MAG: biopolymer transporter ExbD [Bdellovibrionales bacterium]|nr:biopolymer transporter ExbD [Bdellovibrionales bacterium]
MARKKVDDELNLTPFIGLFSLLVCMLLVTAVWLQLRVLSTNIDNVTASDGSSSQNDEKKVNLTVTLLENYIEMAEDTNRVQVAYQNGPEGEAVDVERVKDILRGWKERHPEKKDIILNTENSVAYKHMITVFDTMVGAGWDDVGVNTQ